jgi:ubiquinone/menaquinone biosynthesis C-methylase UbiE
VKRIVDLLRDQSINSILDVCTGKGEFLGFLSENFSKAFCTGIDTDEKALEEALGKFGNSRFRFLKMDAENLEFGSHHFDLVTISNALHHIPGPVKALDEMKRVVVRNGWIVVSEIVSNGLNPAQECQKLFHHHKAGVDRLLGTHHHETFSEAEIISLLSRCALRPTHSFKFLRKNEPERDPVILEDWIAKMETTQKKAEGLTGSIELGQMVADFRNRVFLDGFQPAPNLVMICRVE